MLLKFSTTRRTMSCKSKDILRPKKDEIKADEMVKMLLQACDISRAFWTITSSRLQLFKWSAVSLTRLAFFFFSRRLEFFFCLDSNFKISNRVCSHDICLVFFRSWTYILQISTHVFYCIRCILQVSTYVLCFQHVFTISIILSATERHTYLYFRFLMEEVYPASWSYAVSLIFKIKS